MNAPYSTVGPFGVAIEIVRETPVSLVLSDHMLSGATGIELAAEIKKIKPDVPVVLYSGRPPESMENIDCFINKGESVVTFLSMMRDVVNRYWGVIHTSQRRDRKLGSSQSFSI